MLFDKPMREHRIPKIRLSPEGQQAMEEAFANTYPGGSFIDFLNAWQERWEELGGRENDIHYSHPLSTLELLSDLVHNLVDDVGSQNVDNGYHPIPSTTIEVLKEMERNAGSIVTEQDNRIGDADYDLATGTLDLLDQMVQNTLSVESIQDHRIGDADYDLDEDNDTDQIFDFDPNH